MTYKRNRRKGKRNPHKPNLEKLKVAASVCDTAEGVAEMLGISRNRLRYFLYTKYDEEDEQYTQAFKNAYFDGRTEYRKNRYKNEAEK